MIHLCTLWLRNLYFTAGQSFGRDGGLNGDIGGYFSNSPSNNIGGNDNVGSSRQNGGNNGYQY